MELLVKPEMLTSYIYTTLAFLALLGALYIYIYIYIYDISSLRVKIVPAHPNALFLTKQYLDHLRAKVHTISAECYTMLKSPATADS